MSKTNKDLKEQMDLIKSMDDVELFMTTLAIARAEAIANYLMVPKGTLEEDLALYTGSMIGRLNSRMVKREFRKSINDGSGEV